jgi:hypothetical protein
MTITRKVWSKYISNLRKINEEAARLANQYLTTHEVLTPEGTDALIEYCYGLAVKYGEAASELAAQMYDALAAAQGASVPPAIPAEVATYGDVANTVLGIQKRTQNVEMISSGVARLVKMAGVDTTMKNALRDGAEWAWIPVGDTCAFCITLASNGWQRASKKAIKGGHAEHIHANCDCTYAIRFDDSEVEGYDPGEYRDMYYGAGSGSPRDRINAMRREAYARNREEINAQKRSAYEKRKELNSSAAEEINVD